MKKAIVYLNGRYLDKKAAKVSFLDHGLLYGDGVFETLRAYEGKVFKLVEHIKRLHVSAKNIYLKIPLNFNRISYIIYNLININKLSNCYIRITVTRGVGEPGLDPALCVKPTVIIYAKEIKTLPGLLYKKGVDAVTVSVRKNDNAALPASMKSCNYLNNIIAGIEMRSKKAFEGIMLSREGWVTEATVSNVFIVRNDCLITPPLSVGALGGITRNAVIEIAKKAGIKVSEKKFKVKQLHDSRECFLTNTGIEILPVTKIDGKEVGNCRPGKITVLLMNKYKEVIAAEAKKRKRRGI